MSTKLAAMGKPVRSASAGVTEVSLRGCAVEDDHLGHLEGMVQLQVVVGVSAVVVGPDKLVAEGHWRGGQ